MNRFGTVFGLLVAVWFASVPVFGDVFANYEDLAEGIYGLSFTHQGLTYRDVNLVSGQMPDGSTFEVPEDFRRNVIIEDSTDFYTDFPDFGSPVNTLTFGMGYIVGPNLSLGPLASVWIDIEELSQSVSFDLGFYENGPWGGIEYHFDALLDDVVVGSDSFVISDLGGRDNPTWSTMSISGVQFDQLHLYAWYDGMYSMPRGIIDDLMITAVPEPATFGLLALAGLAALRRR
ncbi:MAG: PEP-CTERM sorting domain-containing protein [Planctomycetes bacterium]|nr:PEP-CTERM sorting domain-containing protein [Planctomycetota bacterium]